MQNSHLIKRYRKSLKDIISKETLYFTSNILWARYGMSVFIIPPPPPVAPLNVETLYAITFWATKKKNFYFLLFCSCFWAEMRFGSMRKCKVRIWCGTHNRLKFEKVSFMSLKNNLLNKCLEAWSHRDKFPT